VQHGRRHYDQREQRSGDDGEGAVALLKSDADLEPDAARQTYRPRGTVHLLRGADPAVSQVVERAEDGHPIACVQRVVAAGACGHRSIATGHDRDWGEVTEVTPEGVVRVIRCLDPELNDSEIDPSQFDSVGRSTQAGLDEGGRGQRRDV
jgi:hypothetical protein